MNLEIKTHIDNYNYSSKIGKPDESTYSSEKITMQLIEELKDPALFTRSCILRGSKYTSSCIEKFDIAIKHINEQLDKHIFDLGQLKMVNNLCQDFEKLELNSKSIANNFSNCRNSLEMVSVPIIEQYEHIKENIMISKRVLQIQDLCNRTIEFISLISRLKLHLGIKKSAKSEEQYNKLFQEIQNGIPESIDILKTSQIIVELENMIYFNEESAFDLESCIKKERIDTSKMASLEFLEELQDDIKWLRKLSAIYRQYGHKKLMKGIENMDKISIYSGCIILDQFNELREHIETLVDDIILKQINHVFQVSILQKCINNENFAENQTVFNTEFVTVSILFVIENAINQLILGLKKLVCFLETIVENNLKINTNTSEVGFVNTFWQKSQLIFEAVFNNIYSVNAKNSDQNLFLEETITISNGSLKLEQLFQIFVNCYPDISNMFSIAIKKIKTLFSTSSAKILLTDIIDEKVFFGIIFKIREKYLIIIKNRFDNLLQSILPSKKISPEYTNNISKKVSMVIKNIINEIKKTKNNPDIYPHIYEIFKNQILYFIVACETIIQPEGGIISFPENFKLSIENDDSIENIYSKLNSILPNPMNSHLINSRVSYIAALLSTELEHIYNTEFNNTCYIIEKEKIVELLKSLQYKSVGKWFSQTLSAISRLTKDLEFTEMQDPEMINQNKIQIRNERSFIIKTQLIVNKFTQEWFTLLSPLEFWYKCSILFCRNIIIIFLVNFALRNNFEEGNCFSIAEDIVSIQSMISQFMTIQAVKNQLAKDLKMMQDFRRVLFSDMKAIKEAIKFCKYEEKDQSNVEILQNSIKSLNYTLISIHLLNRIHFSFKQNFKSIPSFVTFSKLSNFELSNVISSALYKEFNKKPTCESDSDLLLIFDVFNQNTSNKFESHLSVITSIINNYARLFNEELSKSNNDFKDLESSEELVVILDFVNEI